MAATRSVTATWVGGLHAQVDAGGFPLDVDEPPEAGGDGAGPQPTDLFLASVSSCFALAVAWSARRLGVDIGEPGDLTVTAVGEYDGASYAAITITVATGSREPAELDRVLKEAQRVCYVTNTLRRAPDLTFTLAP